MSAALLPPLPASRDASTIAPRLLHSPPHSPALGIHHIMHNYHDNAPDSPHNLYYPPSPASEIPQSPETEPITSPSGMLIVHSYSPASGRTDDLLTVQMDFRPPLHNTSVVHLRIVLADFALPTLVHSNSQPPDRPALVGRERGQWNIEASIPRIRDVLSHMAEVGLDGRLEWPLSLQALDASGNLLDTAKFGLFSYEVSPESSPMSSPSYNHKSRSRSPNKRSREDDDDADYSPPTPIKRLAMDTEAMNLRRMSVASAEGSFVGSQPRPIAHRVLLEGPSPIPSHTLPPKLPLHPHVYQHSLHIQTPPHPQHMPPEAFRVQPVPEEYSDDGPALVRTTQLVSSGERLAGAKAAQASVAVQGDLEAMKHGWSDAEHAAGRRLVQFWKRQVGTTLHISFGAIPQHQYTDNTIVVSCIYRDNFDECFITSVDVIYLLEALAGNRFEVEEKNRIRRNLEGFKPMTISKSKPGTEEFFKIIMEFAAPKPRNIEKDVKVFEWGKLKMMLEKVFSKYSTVPLSPTTSCPPFEGSTAGTSGNTYALPSSKDEAHFRSRSRSPEMQTRSSPASTPRLPEVHQQDLLPASGSSLYAEQFAPAKYDDGLEYNGGIEASEYPYDGMHFLGAQSELNSGYFKDDMSSPGNMNGIVNANAPVILPAPVPSVGRPLDGFRSASPLSSDNSPESLSLSLSSGHSSDSGQVESHNLGGISMSNTEHLKPMEHL